MTNGKRRVRERLGARPKATIWRPTRRADDFDVIKLPPARDDHIDRRDRNIVLVIFAAGPAVGPSFSGDGTMATYQDIVEMMDDDHYVFRSQVRQPDGSWPVFMEADYRRAAA